MRRALAKPYKPVAPLVGPAMPFKTWHEKLVEQALSERGVYAYVTGPRQAGKTIALTNMLDQHPGVCYASVSGFPSLVDALRKPFGYKSAWCKCCACKL